VLPVRLRHRLDRAEALLCPKGHALPPTIAMAAIQLKENPAQPKRGMRPEAQLIRALVAMNRSSAEAVVGTLGPGPISSDRFAGRRIEATSCEES